MFHSTLPTGVPLLVVFVPSRDRVEAVMLSEQQIREAMHASRVLPIDVPNPHGPLGLEQLAEAVESATGAGPGGLSCVVLATATRPGLSFHVGRPSELKADNGLL